MIPPTMIRVKEKRGRAGGDRRESYALHRAKETSRVAGYGWRSSAAAKTIGACAAFLDLKRSLGLVRFS